MSKFNIARLMSLKSLVAISPSMRFRVNGDRICLSHKNEDIGYLYSFPKEDFPFEGDIASFIDFKEFISILNMLSPNSTLEQDPDDIAHLTLIDQDQNIRISYGFSDDSIDFGEGPAKFSMNDIDASVELTSSDFSKIKKFIAAVSAEKIHVSIKKSVCTLKFFRDKKGDSCEMKFVANNTSDIDYVITADFFMLLPDGNATLDFKSEGIISLKYITDEDVNFLAVTGIMED